MGAHGLTFLCYKSTHTAQPDPDVATRPLTRLVARVFSAPSYRLIYSAVVSFLPSSPSPYHLPAVRRTQNWRSGLFCSKRRLSCISSHPSASPSTVKVIIAKIGAENSVPFGPPESDERSERSPSQRHTCMFPMGAPSRVLSVPRCQLVTCLFLVMMNVGYVVADISDNIKISRQREDTISRILYDCDRCNGRREIISAYAETGNFPDDEDIDIVATYSDTSGAIRLGRVKMKDLSASWMWDNPIDGNHGRQRNFQAEIASSNKSRVRSGGRIQYQKMQTSAVSPVMLKRKMMRQERQEQRTSELIQQDKQRDNRMVDAAIERSKSLDTTIWGKYSIWRRDYENPNSDSTVKLMRDQIIMAKAYATIAKSKNDSILYNSLVKHTRESQRVIGAASSDADLGPSALDQAKAMGHMLSLAKNQLYECLVTARKLRAMLQSAEENVNSAKKKSAFLIQLAAKTVPRPLHCLPLQLAADYFFLSHESKNDLGKEKIEDPSLYHYAIFSDNVLATSVVVNSTVQNSKEPGKHVFHIVTDNLNFPAMKMWFIANPPAKATVQVESIYDFKWLNSSYCSVLRQLESARMKEYYFKANQASSLLVGADNLKYRNPKYLSMLNHLRFYLPEVYPKLDKILFLDDDIVVQKDLTPLWSVDLHGMVNGAVETCKDSFHRFDKYLNFSNPMISDNFDPNACGWAFGMNIFNLKEWRKRNITGIYHRWQDMNEDRTLWKLGTLPPGLITFYNLTHPLDRRWHVLGLGYDPALNQTEIENAGVIHYNGNYKPWLDLAFPRYQTYWSKYVEFDNPYLLRCNINE